MPRISHKDSVLNAMKELCTGQDKKILNSDIFNKLKWNREKFLSVRNKLHEDDVLTYEGHYTKFVDFAKDGRQKPECKIFISYSHADEDMKDELLKHLSPLYHMNLIETWHDRKMKAGHHIDSEISSEIKTSNLILLLVSADFLNSEYCYHREMIEAVKRHNNKEAVVIPVILRHCYWNETPFGKLLAATKDAKPVSDYLTRDAAFLEIVLAIKKRITL